jgi:cytochrome c556
MWKWREAAVFAGALALVAATASAQTVYEKRTAYMKGLGGSMGAIGKYVKGEADYSPAVAEAGQKLHMHSKDLVSQFPKDTVGESRAKPEIWANWSDFEAKAKTFQDAAAKLAEATKTEDKQKIADAHAATGKTCGGCHDTFRAPPKKS